MNMTSLRTKRARSLSAAAIVALAAVGLSALPAMSDEDLPVATLAAGYHGEVPIFDLRGEVVAKEATRRAAAASAESCMAVQGIEYRDDYSLAQHVPAWAALVDGATNREFASIYGFGLTPTLQAVPDGPPVGGLDGSGPSQSFVEAYTGTEISPGCNAAYDVVAAFGAGYSVDYLEVLALKQNFSVAPVVRAYYSEWSACMGRSGHSYVSPLDAFTQLVEAAAAGSLVRATEVDIAMATIDCGGDPVNLLPTDLVDQWAEYVLSFFGE